MKRSVLIAVFLLAATTGCGIVDSATPESIPDLMADENNSVLSDDPLGAVTTVITKEEKTSSESAVTSSANTTVTTVTAVNSTFSAGGKSTTGTGSSAKATSAQTSVHTVRTVRTTSAPAVTTSTAPVTTLLTKPIETNNNFITCNMTSNGIEIMKNGDLIQFIEQDMEQILDYYQNNEADQNMKLAIRDYDFDGYDDLFIPEYIGTLNTSGNYWHYDPQSGLFTEWDEMKDVRFSVTPDEMDQTLYSHEKLSASEYEDKTYRWENGSIVLIKMKKQFCINDSADGSENIYIDHYEFINGEKKTVKREKLIFDENGNCTGITEVPIEWTLR